jgi:hypothetical protein
VTRAEFWERAIAILEETGAARESDREPLAAEFARGKSARCGVAIGSGALVLRLQWLLNGRPVLQVLPPAGCDIFNEWSTVADRATHALRDLATEWPTGSPTPSADKVTRLTGEIERHRVALLRHNVTIGEMQTEARDARACCASCHFGRRYVVAAERAERCAENMVRLLRKRRAPDDAALAIAIERGHWP